MRDQQASLDSGGKPIAGDILDRIRNESRDQAEKGRWFEQLFMRLALQQLSCDALPTGIAGGSNG